MRVVMTFGDGGRIVDHRMTFEGYFRSGTKVELRGPCYSACTLLLGYLKRPTCASRPAPSWRFTPSAARNIADYMVDQTRAMYETFRRKFDAGSIDKAGGKICR